MRIVKRAGCTSAISIAHTLRTTIKDLAISIKARP
jgi:hypothetical protein